jgi:purine-nucleoside phosphorylase
MNLQQFGLKSFAPIADFGLLAKAAQAAEKKEFIFHVGNIFSTDTFYDESDPPIWKIFAKYGVLAIEMESAILYTIAARYGVRALSILTVSDDLTTDNADSLSTKELETECLKAVDIALAACEE